MLPETQHVRRLEIKLFGDLLDKETGINGCPWPHEKCVLLLSCRKTAAAVAGGARISSNAMMFRYTGAGIPS